jgi:hypothetical protein
VDPLAASNPNAEIHLADLVLADGKRLQAEGKLDAALDRYVAAERIALHTRQCWPWLDVADTFEIRVCEQLTSWAACAGQKPDRVLAARRTMEEQWRDPPPYCDYIKRNYLLAFRILEGDHEALRELRGSTDEPSYVNFTRWLPWERARALRLLNKLTAEEFARCRQTEAVLAVGGFVPPRPDVENSLWRSKDPTDNIVGLNLPFGNLDHWLTVETHRRGTRLVLALEAWKLDHGGLPQSLEDLKGKYLDQLPVGPYTGSAFRYEPKGLPYYVAWLWQSSLDTKTLEPGRPFVACDSWSTKGYRPSSDGDPRPPEGRTGADSSRTEVWEGVWVFPIP